MRNTIFSKNNRGFALPTVVIAGLVLLIIGASGLQAAGSSTRAVMDQSWNAMAFEAKESGIKYIESCLRDSNDNSDPARPWTQTLTQSTNCQGGNLSGAPSYIDSEPAAGNSPAWRTSFSATAPANNTTLDRRVSTVTGKVEVLSSSGVPIRSYTSSSTVVLNVQGAQLGVQVAKISTTNENTCTLLTNNKVYCSGNPSGLAQPTEIVYTRPIDISPFPNGEGALDVVMATNERYQQNNGQTCILSTAYKVYCAGDNTSGNFGNGGSPNYLRTFMPTTGSATFGGSSPITVKSSPVLSGSTKGTPPYSYMCAIAVDDNVYCSGYYFVLGNGNSGTNSSVPVLFDGIPDIDSVKQVPLKIIPVRDINQGTQYPAVCVLTDTGRVYCHGGNGAGSIGTGSTNALDANTPTLAYPSITSEGKIIDFGSGPWKTCALYESGALYCAGRFPDPAAPTVSTPARFGGTSNPKSFSEFSMSGTSLCAIESVTKDVYCLSLNSFGQLGTGNTTINRDISNPTKVAGAGSYMPSNPSLSLTRVHAGDGKICLQYNVAGAEDTTGFLTCAGKNNYGQLGVGDTVNRTVFGSQYILPSGVYVKKVFINREGGLGNRGPTNSDETHYTGADAGNLTGPVYASGFSSTNTGSTSFCVLGTDGNAYCAGRNNLGQLGDTTTTNRSTPVKFVLPTNP